MEITVKVCTRSAPLSREQYVTSVLEKVNRIFPNIGRDMVEEELDLYLQAKEPHYLVIRGYIRTDDPQEVK